MGIFREIFRILLENIKCKKHWSDLDFKTDIHKDTIDQVGSYFQLLFSVSFTAVTAVKHELYK